MSQELSQPKSSEDLLRSVRRWYADETPSKAEEKKADAEAPADSKPPEEPKTYDAAYVKELRDEAAGWRRKLRESEAEMDKIQAQLDKLSKAQKKREEEELTQQQEWQQLAEKRAKELEDLQGEITKRDKLMLRLKIAQEFGLNVALDEDGQETLADRLRGDTEEELRADAAKLAPLAKALVQGKSAPDDKPQTPATGQEARRQTTTTAVPGGKPVGRTDADRRSEYFTYQNDSPIFQKGGLTVPTSLKEE